MSGIPRRYAALFSSVVLIGALASAPAAYADDFSRVDRDPVGGASLVLADGQEVDTALFSLRVADEDSVRAYAAEADKEVRPHTAYVESAWSDHPQWTETTGETAPADRVNWIVTHSYPNVELPLLSLEVGLLHLDESQAIAGTQAALWHVLEGVEPDRDANGTKIVTLYDHLMENSASAAGHAIARSLEVSPTHLEAIAPKEPLGPVTVRSAGTEPVQVSVHGAPASWLVGADGDQVTQAHDGEELFLDVDPSVPAGVVTLHARGQDVPLPEGRLFTGRDGVRTQPLVTAEAGSARSSTNATFTWHPSAETGAEETAEPDEAVGTAPVEEAQAPDESARGEAPTEEPSPESDDHISEDDLASTGTWLSGLLIIAGALLVSGLLILVLGRKKRG